MLEVGFDKRFLHSKYKILKAKA